MVLVVFIIFMIISAFLYTKFYKKRLTYLNIPNNIISFNYKENILRIHVFISLVISILVTKNAANYISDENYVFMLTVLIIYIIIFFIIGHFFDLILKKLNPNVSFINTINKNPILLEELEHLKTDQMMELDEFWNFLNPTNSIVTPSLYKINLHNLYLQLEKYHPIKLIEFENRLSNLRDELISKDLFQIFLYIWGSKYHETYNEFIEFIISQGKTKYELIKLDLNNLTDLDFDIYQLNNVNIYSIISELYTINVGRIYLFKNSEKEMNVIINTELDSNKIKVTFPKIYTKFK